MNKYYILILKLILISAFLGCSSTAFSEESKEKLVKYNNVLFKSKIDTKDGDEILIREAFFPPNWKAPKHYHNGNLFIYVIEGEFEVIMEETGKVTYTSGQALQMKSGTVMDAKNPSSKNSLKLAVFQVGKPNAAFVVPVE